MKEKEGNVACWLTTKGTEEHPNIQACVWLSLGIHASMKQVSLNIYFTEAKTALKDQQPMNHSQVYESAPSDL